MWNYNNTQSGWIRRMLKLQFCSFLTSFMDIWEMNLSSQEWIQSFFAGIPDLLRKWAVSTVLHLTDRNFILHTFWFLGTWGSFGPFWNSVSHRGVLCPRNTMHAILEWDQLGNYFSPIKGLLLSCCGGFETQEVSLTRPSWSCIDLC